MKVNEIEELLVRYPVLKRVQYVMNGEARR